MFVIISSANILPCFHLHVSILRKYLNLLHIRHCKVLRELTQMGGTPRKTKQNINSFKSDANHFL